MKIKLEVFERKRKEIADILIQNLELCPSTVFNLIEIFKTCKAIIEIENLNKNSQLLSQIEDSKLKYVSSFPAIDTEYVDIALLCPYMVSKDILGVVLNNQPETITIFGFQSKSIKWEDFLYNMNKVRFKKLVECHAVDLLFTILVDENVINLSFSTKKYILDEIVSELKYICSSVV